MTEQRRPLTIARAFTGDLPIVRELLAQSARWMHSQGWTAWPSAGFPDSRIMPGIEAGEVWLLQDRGRTVGTLTLDQRPELEFTAPEAVEAGVDGLLPQAWIGHRLAVDRANPGVYGALLVEWSLDWTFRRGGKWRLTNVARRAEPLQAWYRKQGFAHLATVTSTRTDAGAPRQSGYLMGQLARAVPAITERVTEIG